MNLVGKYNREKEDERKECLLGQIGVQYYHNALILYVAWCSYHHHSNKLTFVCIFFNLNSLC
jgi:hypothetical protein